MANSKSLPANNASLASSVHHFLARLLHARSFSSTTLLAAFSGGLDSSVLLHVLVSLQAKLRFNLEVMHVHHGLSANADAWADFCLSTCVKYGVPCQVVRVQVDTSQGLGIEAAARHARYAALNLASADYIALAHHQDDQAETVMLQLARGAGVKGMSAMAMQDESTRLIRPLLAIGRADLETYAKAHGLAWIEDESNSNQQYARNAMRHAVLPTIAQHYPAITATLARTANHMAEASALLDELAAIDATKAIQTASYSTYTSLNLAVLQELSLPRASNLLRFWLAQNAVLMPSTEQLTQLRNQLLTAASSANVKISVGSALSVRRYVGWACLVRDTLPASGVSVYWHGESTLSLGHGTLKFEHVLGQGLSQKRLAAGALSIETRTGGEMLQPESNRPRRSLKTLLQQAAIPTWLRPQWPLVMLNAQLICVPNVAVDVRWQAQPDELGLVITWQAAG